MAISDLSRSNFFGHGQIQSRNKETMADSASQLWSDRRTDPQPHQRHISEGGNKTLDSWQIDIAFGVNRGAL